MALAQQTFAGRRNTFAGRIYFWCAAVSTGQFQLCVWLAFQKAGIHQDPLTLRRSRRAGRCTWAPLNDCSREMGKFRRTTAFFGSNSNLWTFGPELSGSSITIVRPSPVPQQHRRSRRQDEQASMSQAMRDVLRFLRAKC